MSTVYVHNNLDSKTIEIQDNERYIVKLNGNNIKAIKHRLDQIEKEKVNIFDDLQIRLYELMIREKVLSDLFVEKTGDTL